VWAAVLAAGVAVALSLIMSPLPGSPGAADEVGGAGHFSLTLLVGWLIVLWTMTVAADERALGPLVLREPLVAAGAAGLIVGQPGAGWLLGVVLQSIWPGLQPLGGSRPPWAGPGSVVGVLWLVLLPAGVGPWRLPIALAAAFTAAWAGIGVEDRLRARNDRRESGLLAAPREARRALLGAHIHLGIVESAVGGAAVLVGLIVVPLGLIRALSGAPLAPWAGTAGSWLEVGGSPYLLVAAAVTSLLGLGGVVGRQARGWRARRAWGVEAQRDRAAPVPAEPAAQPATPPRRLGARRLWALLALQAGFGNRFMQRSGFLHFLLLGSGSAGRPAGGQLQSDLADELADEILGGGALNTQPIMAAALLGATERVLDEARREPPPRPVVRLLELGGSLLAQWGDRALWGAVRPALALLALACAALGPAAAAGYGAIGLVLSLVARAGLYRWGWAAGWDVVRGSGSWAWRRLPAVATRSLSPLAIVAAASIAAALAQGAGAGGGVRGPANFFSLGVASFILGVPLGAALRSRPLAWAWICGAAGAGALMLGRGLGW